MKQNVGGIDRIVRAVLGVILLALVFVGPKTPWGWLGLVLLGTSALSFCPLYPLLGMSTRKDADGSKPAA